MKKILIVEDDEAINNLIANTLRQEMYDCYSASTGKEGADMFEQRQYDLVLLDLMLPEIIGYELLEFIKPTDTQVIIISAMGQVQDFVWEPTITWQSPSRSVSFLPEWRVC